MKAARSLLVVVIGLLLFLGLFLTSSQTLAQEVSQESGFVRIGAPNPDDEDFFNPQNPRFLDITVDRGEGSTIT